MGPLHLHGIAGVVAVHGEGGDEDRAVDADLVHRGHHLVTRDVIGPVRHTVPRSLRRVRLIGMDLGIDNRHRGSSSVLGDFGHQQADIRRDDGYVRFMSYAARPAPFIMSYASSSAPASAASIIRLPIKSRSVSEV